jgi:hypothetical protein
MTMIFINPGCGRIIYCMSQDHLNRFVDLRIRNDWLTPP